ncbi:MAG: hypothetical protein ACXVW4_15890 [Nocardioides sp.]
MASTTVASPATRQARARAAMAGVWFVAAAALAALLLAARDAGSPAGRSMAVLGGTLLVGAVVALALVAVNASLARDPRREDARGAADLLSFAAALVGVLTVLLVLVLGRPIGAVGVAMAVLGALLLAMLFGIAFWTRTSAPRRGAQP